MNRLLFNLYYSSNHSYKSNSNYILFFFQLLNNFHILIILDIIFNKSSITSKTVSFPFYFLSPILYLEHFLTNSNKDFISNESTPTIIPSSNDQL